jgi:hypothetical protein
MPTNYDDTDIRWTWNGDFGLGSDGDLADTTGDHLESLIQEIHTVIASEFDDWEIYPNRAAGLGDFVGEGNTRSTGDQIHDRVRLALTSSGLVREEDLAIRVIPVHMHRVLIHIKVNALPTANNKLLDDPLVTQILFDYNERGIYTLDRKPKIFGGRA